MRVSNLHLENWRNFLRMDVTLQQRSFLVGPNAAGKSNFLDALRFLRDLASVGGGFEKAVADRGGVSHLRCLSARRYPAIVIDAAIDNGSQSAWRYRLSFSQDNQRRPEIREESVWHGGRQVLRRPDQDDELDPERLRQTHLEQLNSNLGFRPVAEFFASIRYHHIVPQLVREPQRWQGHDADPFGGDFIERIFRMPAKTRNARLLRIEKALQIAVPQLSSLKVERDERGIAHLYGKYQHWRPTGAWQTEFDFSDGTLRLVGLLWALLDGTGPLLLEEPELSLNPSVVRYLPQLMARLAGRTSRQVLTSTHSSELLSDSGIAPDEVLIFDPRQEGTSVRTGADLDEIRQLLDAELTMAEAVLPMTRPDHVERLTSIMG